MKKTLMMMAIAVCAASAQAKNSTQAQENATAGIGFQLQESPRGTMTDKMVSYTSVYSLSASDLLSKIKETESGVTELTVENVGEWLSKSFVKNSEWIKDEESPTTQWTVAEGVHQFLTSTHGTSTKPVLIARTATDDTDVADHEWMLAFYKDSMDFFRVVHAIKGNGKVRDAENTLNLSTGSLVITNGDGSSQFGDWVAVPEPTSGMLMLLGLAGLALKRKRA